MIYRLWFTSNWYIDYHACGIPGIVSVHIKCWLIRQTHQQPASQHWKTDQCTYHSPIIFNHYVNSNFQCLKQQAGVWENEKVRHNLVQWTRTSAEPYVHLMFLESSDCLQLANFTNGITVCRMWSVTDTIVRIVNSMHLTNADAHAIELIIECDQEARVHIYDQEVQHPMMPIQYNYNDYN